ncbi:MAG TPA: hypothetical protein PLK08_06380 [Phycisphaerae bacterium]|nr:hypothetical protein [Phycisphaerae bacterium]
MRQKRIKNRGVALVMAIILMAMLMAVMLILTAASQKDIAKTVNQQQLFNSRLAAESGFAFMRHNIEECELSSSSSMETVLDGLYSYLSTTIGSVSRVGTAIKVAARNMPTGSFEATIAKYDDDELVLSVTGAYGSTTRTLTLNYACDAGSRSPIFDYGFSSRGTLKMSGSCVIIGKNDSSEANVYMANMDSDKIISLSGVCCIGGKVFATNPDAYVNAAYSCSVDGLYRENIPNSVYTGVDEIELPTIDITQFTNGVSFTDITSSSTTSGIVNLSNIRIKAGTNPHFSGDVDITGVIYIESPNKVTFSGDVNLTGVIVADKGTSDSSCAINISGGVKIHSPSELPDEEKYSNIRNQIGTSILAEGFSVTFSGNNESVDGTMAADTFSFSGYGYMNVKGGIICYKDGEVVNLSGNQTIIIDRSDGITTPPGFTGGSTTVLAPESSTYVDSGS